MKRTRTGKVTLSTSETINRTLTAGSQTLNIAITGAAVAVTGGSPEAVALANAVLSLVQPDAPAGPTPAKSGRGSGQAGRKRGKYKKRTPAPETPATGEGEQSADEQTDTPDA